MRGLSRRLARATLAVALAVLAAACIETPLAAGQTSLTQDRTADAPAIGETWEPRFFEQPWTTTPGGEFLQGRRVAPNGSFAGPWIEGPLAAFLPVNRSSLPRGRALAARLCADCEEGGGAGALFARDELLAAATGWTVPWIESYLRLAFGHDGFPALRDRLTPVQIWDLVTYARASIGPGLETLPTSRELFIANCGMCHGSQGFGDGHEGHWLVPPSANFQQVERMLNRSDQQIYNGIRHGVYGSAMPQWKDVLTDEQIRLLTFYVRSFNYTVDR